MESCHSGRVLWWAGSVCHLMLGVPKPGCLKSGRLQCSRGGALLRAFAPFCALLRSVPLFSVVAFALLCGHLSSFASFCVRPHLGRIDNAKNPKFDTHMWLANITSLNANNVCFEGLIFLKLLTQLSQTQLRKIAIRETTHKCQFPSRTDSNKAQNLPNVLVVLSMLLSNNWVSNRWVDWFPN